MHVKARIEQPESINVTLTITMSFAEWEQMKGQQVIGYPSGKLAETISYLLRTLRRETIQKVEAEG